jgi:hypothetical protein
MLYNLIILKTCVSVRRFFSGRPLINGNLAPKFAFLNDDLRGDKVRLGEVIPQEDLPNSIRTQIDTELRQVSDVCNLLRLAEITRDFLLVTGGPDSEVLHIRMKKLRLVSGGGRNGDGSNQLHVTKILKQVRLGQLDGFISALSLLRAKRMMSIGQRPYTHVAAQFLEPLPRELASPTTTRRLLSVNQNADVILSKLHGFILEMLCEGGAVEDQPGGVLRDFIFSYLSGRNEDELAAKIREEMPEGVKNEHAIALLQHLVRKINE